MKALRDTIASLLATAVCAVCAVCAACSGGGDECRVDGDCPAGSFCQGGDCAYDCVFDRDCPEDFRCDTRGRCERGCAETNGGVEACDGLDNDCDGDTDEEWPDLGTACSNEGCPEGLWVCTSDGAGLECDGPRPAADDATCDGVDDDCDGYTDEDAEQRPCPLQDGLCAGAQQHCEDGAWSRCDYGPGYTAGVDENCDGVDEDCDGATDEDAAALPVAELGAQAGDGLDNNCSGVADEPGGVMVPIGQGVAIDAYEVVLTPAADCADPDAYGLESDDYPAGFPAAGQRTTEVYACSLPGRLPSGHVSWYRAQWACRAQGKRLCTGAEWHRACAGSQSLAFPYGQYLVPAACNIGFPEPGSKAASGDFADCTNDYGCYDMSGNVLEWVADDSDFGPDSALVAGGAYYCQLCDDGARCRPCRPCRTDGADDFEVDKMVNCYPDPNRDYESYPRATAEPFMGTRCCWDIP